LFKFGKKLVKKCVKFAHKVNYEENIVTKFVIIW